MKLIPALFLLLVTTLCSAQSRELKLATYNIRYDNAADAANGNGWVNRCPAITNLIRYNDFDLFGTQECLFHQLINLRDSLKEYSFIGIGRDDGKKAGEHSAIFYKTSVFELLERGDFWLSPTMTKPEKAWDAALPRICSWGLFKVKKTGFMFYCFNLHMDHQGVVARSESAKMVMNYIHKRSTQLPVILMGDFNANQHDEPYQFINNEGLLHDAFQMAPVKWAPTASFNGFDAERKSDARIDHIFLSMVFKVKRYAILNNTYINTDIAAVAGKPVSIQRFPSDHFPVSIIVSY